VDTSVFQRQRTERLARLIDETGGAMRSRSRSQPGTPDDNDLTRMVAITDQLSGMEFRDQSEPEFRSGLRSMLMATIERDGIGATAVDPGETGELSTVRHRRFALARIDIGRTVRRPRGDARGVPVHSRRARGAIVISLVGAAIGIAGMLPASGNAVPGDTLYGVKRSTERAQLALAGSDASRGQLYLDFARNRMNEALSLRNDPAGLADVLADMDDETRQGVKLLTTTAMNRHETAPLDAVDSFVGSQHLALSGLAARLTGPADTQVRTSTDLLDAITGRTAALRATLVCDRPAEAQPAPVGPRYDELGPRPAQCAVGRGPDSPAQTHD